MQQSLTAKKPISASFSAKGMYPLAVASPQTELFVVSVKGADDCRRFLENLGFVSGCSVTVVNRMGDNMIVDVKGSRVALSQQMAVRIMVSDMSA